MIHLESTRKDRRQSDEQWNGIKGIIEETTERQKRKHRAFTGREYGLSQAHIIMPSLTELN